MKRLNQLEAEAIYVLREVAANFKNPVLLFSGGKDSLCLLLLSVKAFRPDRFPYPVLHIDTGHNFPEALHFRDKVMEDLQEKLIIRKVEDTIKAGRAKEDDGPYASRNRQQAKTLLDALDEFNFDAAIGGARRDEEKARAKERFFSPRFKGGGWNPNQQRAELWNLYNTDLTSGGNMRVFPLNNWSELDVWQWLKKESATLPSLYFSHKRKIVTRSNGIILPLSEYIKPTADDVISEEIVRFRTVGDMTCTSPVLSQASTIDDVIQEIISSDLSERGSRADDKTSDAAMEDRKREGYF
ncbi:MAG: sulfate adenylyltransferase subunit 2 [Bacteriovoracaceae bacterium]|nr:sulfate adenylyltransferase subunit 2 [Bacteriovoracaceae bacterium]